MDMYSGPERRRSVGRLPDTTALVASIFAIIGSTMLILALGGAIGVDVSDAVETGAITTEFGTWAVLSAVVGTMLGCVVGGMVCVRHGVTSAIGHSIAAFCGALVVGALLGALGVPALMGSAMAFTGGDGAAVTEIGWSGWALFVALVASLPAAVGGWLVGLVSKPRAATEFRIEEHRMVRPKERVHAGNGHSTVR